METVNARHAAINAQKDLEQLVTAKNTYYNALKQELETPQAAE